MQAEFRPDDDHRSTRVINALTKQVLSESTGLALEHVRETLQRALARTRDDPTATAVIKECIYRFLKHSLFIANNYFRRIQLLESLQAIIAVNHAAVEIVQVRRRKATSIERNKRAKIGRDHRHDLEDHKLRVIDLRLAERVEHLEALRDLLSLCFRSRFSHVFAQSRAVAFNIEFLQESTNRLSTDTDFKCVATVLLPQFDEALVRNEFALLKLRVLGIKNDMSFEVKDLLEVTQGDLEDVADARGQRLQEPNMGHRRSQRDMPHALAAHLGLDNFDAALFANYATMLHALVLAAIAFVVLYRTEDLRAEEPIPLGLECPVVDGLRLLHFTE